MQRRDVIENIKGWGVRPVHPKNVFLLWDETPKEVEKHGILIPGPHWEHQNQARYATVISVGKDVCGVRPDDRVIINKAYGMPIPHAESAVCKLILVSEDQIDALIED